MVAVVLPPASSAILSPLGTAGETSFHRRQHNAFHYRKDPQQLKEIKASINRERCDFLQFKYIESDCIGAQAPDFDDRAWNDFSTRKLMPHGDSNIIPSMGPTVVIKRKTRPKACP